MRVMLRVKLPVEAGNAAIADGSIAEGIGGFMKRHSPEAAYFLVEGGTRTAYFFVDLKEVSDIPVMAEGFFFGLKAQVDMTPVMNFEELRKGLAGLSPQ